MSGDPNQEDAFRLVTRIRKNRSTRFKHKPRDFDDVTPLTNEQKLKAISHIEEGKEDLLESDLFQSVRALLKEGITLLENPEIKEIICLGLGRVGECLRSKYQLAFLLCLRDIYKVELKFSDPVFTEDDKYILNHFNVTILTENLEGKYKVEKSVTIFFLPHCPKQLTNNILFTNWGLNLHYCILICNCFSGIIEFNPRTYLARSAEFLLKISPHAVELPIANTFKFYDIFNDTAVHIFPESRLKLLPIDFWSPVSEPNYTDEDCEFIRP